MGARIRERRAVLGWSQRDLARRSGVSKGMISFVETGGGGIGTEHTARLADALGVTMDQLWHGESTDPTAWIVKLLRATEVREGESWETSERALEVGLLEHRDEAVARAALAKLFDAGPVHRRVTLAQGVLAQHVADTEVDEGGS